MFSSYMSNIWFGEKLLLVVVFFYCCSWFLMAILPFPQQLQSSVHSGEAKTQRSTRNFDQSVSFFPPKLASKTFVVS